MVLNRSLSAAAPDTLSCMHVLSRAQTHIKKQPHIHTQFGLSCLHLRRKIKTSQPIVLKQKILSLHEEPDVWSTAIGGVEVGGEGGGTTQNRGCKFRTCKVSINVVGKNKFIGCC